MTSTTQAAGLPVAATDIAHSFDTLWAVVLWLSVFFFILVVGAMILFAVKYRKSAGVQPKYITGNIPLEVVWTVIPTALLLGIFGWGYYVYLEMMQPPSNAMEIRVTGKQWLWQFQYPETGMQLTNELFVPANRAIKLVMSSEDVLHDFFIPNFRVKSDVVPGMFTTIWFKATVPGRHQVYCAEYCGASHSRMLASINVLTDEQWAHFNRGIKITGIPVIGIGTAMAPAAAADAIGGSASSASTAPKLSGLASQGKALTESRGCVACHLGGGEKGIGPSFQGLYGSTVQLADGSSVTADENYIKESIEDPNAKITKGYSPVMPTFKGQITLPEQNAIIAYIQSLKK